MAAREKYENINSIVDAPSYLIKILIIPAIVFGPAMKFDWVLLKHHLVRVMALAIPIFISTIFVVSALFWGALQYKVIMNYTECLLCSTILSCLGQTLTRSVLESVDTKE